MSKIGKKPIVIESTTQVLVNNQQVEVKGKDGSLSFNLPEEIKPVIEESQLILKVAKENRNSKALHGLWRAILNNAVIGVNKLWEKRLELVGTGYRVKMQGEDLFIEVGFSHPILFKKFTGVKYNVEGNNKIIVSGIDKELVGQIAHKIKKLKNPDPYKGKGIRYEGEFIKLKPGKKAKTAGA